MKECTNQRTNQRKIDWNGDRQIFSSSKSTHLIFNHEIVLFAYFLLVWLHLFLAYYCWCWFFSLLFFFCSSLLICSLLSLYGCCCSCFLSQYRAQLVPPVACHQVLPYRWKSVTFDRRDYAITATAPFAHSFTLSISLAGLVRFRLSTNEQTGRMCMKKRDEKETMSKWKKYACQFFDR